MSINESLWIDGGVIGRNPSTHGGTWAYIRINKDTQRVIDKQSGLLFPKVIFPLGDVDWITNNLSELYAAYKGILSLPKGWAGRIYSDSQVTIGRITTSEAFAGIPDWLRKEILTLRRGRQWTTKLVSGHPSKACLAKGISLRTGRMVSKWNVACDEECQRLARAYLEDL